jgi:transposase
MTRRAISRELKEKALRLSFRGLSDATIQDYLGISKCTMRRLRQLYRQTGEVVRVPLLSGRPRLLDGLDVQVCLFLSHCLFQS